MTSSAARPVNKRRTSPEEARSAASLASPSHIESIHIALTTELERRREAVNRWRGTSMNDRKGDNTAHE